ncbi:MAG TPA: hypothetical protein VJR24_13030 [Gemmatimonadaceae bacterium]|nr:hypothetical protein [Gemmatimonadaceae bacterium]
MPSAFTMLRPFAPALLGLTGIACVTYPVTPVNELQPGHTVVLTLSDSTIPAMAPRLGPGVFRVKGKLQEIDSLALLVNVSHTTSTRNVGDRYAPSVHWNGDSVSIPRAGIANARQGHVSAVLTAVGVALVGGTIAFMASRNHHPNIATSPPPLP